MGTLLAGLGCELGHIFPVFYGFRGGKGILSGGTLVLLLNWRVAAVAWALFLLLWLTTRYVSLASITATCSAPITVYFVYGHNWLYTGLCLAAPGEYPAPSPRNGEKIQVARQPHGGQGSA